jgi:hypothetical protein
MFNKLGQRAANVSIKYDQQNFTDFNKASNLVRTRSDMNDAILKLQASEHRAEQERIQAAERQAQIRTQIGHNEDNSTPSPASRAVN